MSLLQSFIDKNRVNVSLISFIEPIASFHEIQKITKMSFNIPLNPPFVIKGDNLSRHYGYAFFWAKYEETFASTYFKKYAC